MCISEPVSLERQLMAARASLLSLQEVVAKHNASVRVRYPHSDSLYKHFEKAMMGVFNDIPLQVHAFSYAAENVAYECKELPMDPADIFSDGDVLDRAMAWAGAPQRNSKGVIQWKRSVSHVEAHLAEEIGKQAACFFSAVYALPGVDRKSLSKEEKGFWARYAKLMAAHWLAIQDTDKMEVRVALGKRLPDAICWSIAAYVQ
jgi:hypothetical protein